ncbi:hypothetical protein [Microvirga sp. Mcv34]|uniref:hypothetical protein n=1 Tax=Microvirga sp. Mcv34 TaxID=2926016 RepID=UPI0021C716FD|nr:hypothetical protein [Microvirga sp. Mcv34]
MQNDEGIAILKSSFGLIKASPQEAADAYIKWQKPLARKYGKCLKVETISSDLDPALENLLPINPSANRHLFFPCRNGWSVLFENGFQGTDNTPVCMLAKLMPAFTMRVVETSSLPTFHYPATILDIYESDTWPKRSIAAMDDGGSWIFPQAGEPFAFENLEQYKLKNIRDRFTPILLRQYLGEFSAFPFDSDFYMTGEPAIRIEKVSRLSWPFSLVSRFRRQSG